MANLQYMLGATPEEADIARKRQMAQMLGQQAITPSEGQMVSGHYVAPGAAQTLAKVLSGYMAGKSGREADALQQAAGEKRQSAFRDTAQKYVQALRGTPEQRSQFEADNPFGEDLGNLQTVTPAQAGSREAAMDVALQSQSPEWQQIAMQNVIEQAKQQPKDQFGSIQTQYYTPESLGEFQRTGDYGKLQQAQSSAYGKYNPGQYSTDSWAAFVQSGDPSVLQPRFAPVTQDIGGAKVTYDPATGRELARYLVGLKPGEMPSVRAAQAGAEEAAKGQVKLQTEQAGKQVKLAQSAQEVDSIVSEADSLLKDATGSAIGAGVALGKGAFGISDASTKANAGLKVLGGQLVSKIPRMEGPQSDADVKLYREMAGRIADPTVPVGDRRAALQTLQNINRKYANPTQSARPAQPTGGGYDTEKERRYQEWKARQGK